jgi:hypothetical protein
MTQPSSPVEPPFAAFVAIDWADKKHVWSLQAAGSASRESGEVMHTPEAVASWVATLSARFAGQPIAVGLEQSQGALVFMLGTYGNLHLYPIQVSRGPRVRAGVDQEKIGDEFGMWQSEPRSGAPFGYL